MPSIALPDVREMRTPDLHTLRARSATECLQPLLQSATPAVRELLCCGCPLAEVCTEIRTRETEAGAYATEATTTTPASIAAGTPDGRPRSIRPALGWRERRVRAAAVRTADTRPGGERR